MPKFHPSAIIEDGARISENVTIGAFSHIGADCEIGAGTRIHTNVVISGHTEIGPGCDIYPFAVIGGPPQDVKYDGSPTRLTIGGGTLIREHCTIHRGTPHGGGITTVGEKCFFMVASHVAHDCQIGDGVVMINQATLAGHCQVGDNAIVGGLSAVHQFVRIGKHAFIAGMTGIEHDVIPFGLAKGILRRAHLTGLNLVGLKRRGFPREEIHALRAAYREIFDGDSSEISDRAEQMAEKHAEQVLVMDLVSFIRGRTGRSLCLPQPGNMNRSAEGF